jgi:hypothetical protein
MASVIDISADCLNQLSADWPDWSIWLTRRQEMICATRPYGQSYTLIADDVQDLLAQLRHEQQKRGGS